MACLLYNTGKCLQLLLFNRPNFGVHFSTCPLARVNGRWLISSIICKIMAQKYEKTYFMHWKLIFFIIFAPEVR